MYEFDEMCLKTFIAEQSKLLGKNVFTTLEDADEFLLDSFANIFDSIGEVREFLEDAGMDAYGMSDDELESQAEVFTLEDGRYLVLDC